MPTALCNCSQTSLTPFEFTSSVAETRVAAMRNGTTNIKSLHQRRRVDWDSRIGEARRSSYVYAVATLVVANPLTKQNLCQGSRTIRENKIAVSIEVSR